MKRPAAFLLIAATAAFAWAPPLLAEGMGGGGHRGLRHMDLNGNGEITKEEASAAGAVKFLRMDRDGDGVITEEEMLMPEQERIARRIAKKFARLDQNGDGRVERAEFDDHGTARFVRLDTDGDGLVSEEEFRARKRGPGQGAGRGCKYDRLRDE